MSGSPSLSRNSCYERNFCNYSCKGTWCSWLCLCYIQELEHLERKIWLFPTLARGCSESCGGRLATREQELHGLLFPPLSFPTEMQCIESLGSRTRPCKSRAVSQQELYYGDQIILLLTYTLWTVWQHRRSWSPAFISALWIQLPTCAPQGVWAYGCLVHEPYPVQVWDPLKTQLCQTGRGRYMKLLSAPWAAILNSFKNMQLLNSISYSQAKIL